MSDLKFHKTLCLWRKLACQTLSKALYIIATVQVDSDLLKALAILSDTTVKRSALEWEVLKPYWKLEKRAQVFERLY